MVTKIIPRSSRSWLNRSGPFSREFGLDRGAAIDRRFIESFLQSNKGVICGSLLEIGDDHYIRKYGTRIDRSVVLNGTSSLNNTESYIGDLTNIEGLKNIGRFDCIIATNVLNFIFDFDRAVQGLTNLLHPLTGTVLVTVAGCVPISRFDYDRWGDYWRFSDMSIKMIFEKYFERVEVETFGNAPLAAAFVMGLSQQEVPNALFAIQDPDFQILIGVRASLPKAHCSASPGLNGI